MDTLFFRMLYLFKTGRHLCLGTAVDKSHVSTQALSRAAGVHSRVTTTDDHHLLTNINRSIGIGVSRIHEVDAGEVFVARHHVDVVLTRDVHEVGQSGSRTYKYTAEALILQVLHGDRLAHDAVGLEMNTHLAQVVDLHVYDAVGQSEFGNTIFQHAANFVERLEDIDLVAFLHHVAGKTQSRRSRAHDGHLDAIRRCHLGQYATSALALIVRSKALEIADGHGRLFHLQVYALALALLLLRAYAAADSGQGRGHLQHAGSVEDMSMLDILDKRRNVDIHRASLDAAWLTAVEAAASLTHSHVKCQSFVHLLSASGGAVDGGELRHLHAFNLLALLGRHLLAKFLTPGCIAVDKTLHGLLAVVGRGYCRLSRVASHTGIRFIVVVEVALIVVHFLFFHSFEGAHALHHLIPVDEITVELRAVDAYKLCLSADCQSAGTAHTRTVDHDGVERDIVGDTIFMSQQRGEFHHYRRTNGEHLVDMLALDNLFHADGDHSFLAVGAVVGHDDDLITVFLDVIDHDDKILCTSGEHRDDAVAGLFERGEYWEDGCNANATSGTHYGTVFLNLRRIAQGSYDILHLVTNIELTELGRGQSHLLHHEGKGALFGV